MSIGICAFLGPSLEDLKSRFIQSFDRIGFKIELHPEMDLLSCNSAGCLTLVILETPSTLKRLAPGVPLLADFEYGITPRDSSLAGTDSLPRGVKQYSYKLFTRTASGRSRSSYFMQALTAAILATETGGYVLFDGKSKAMSGKKALEKVLDELNGLDADVIRLNEILANLETDHGIAAANHFARSMHESFNAAFDVGGIPFSTWPSIEQYYSFPNPTPISLPPFEEKPEPWWSRISLYWAMMFLFVTFMVVLTVTYS